MTSKKAKDQISRYLSRIGSIGGKARAAKHDSKTISEWGKLGGRPKKKASPDKQRKKGGSK